MEGNPRPLLLAESSNSSSPLLPLECLEGILRRCSPRDICRCAAVSRDWRRAAQSEDTWRQTCEFLHPLFHALPELAACDSPLRALSVLHKGISVGSNGGTLRVDLRDTEAAGGAAQAPPRQPLVILSFPASPSLPLYSLARSMIKYSIQREAAGYSGHFGSVLLLWLHQMQGLLAPHFSLLPGKYSVSLNVGSTLQEVEELNSPSAEGTVSLSESDARAGGDVQSAMDLFAGMDLLAESPCSDLFMLSRKQRVAESPLDSAQGRGARTRPYSRWQPPAADAEAERRRVGTGPWPPQRQLAGLEADAEPWKHPRGRTRQDVLYSGSLTDWQGRKQQAQAQRQGQGQGHERGPGAEGRGQAGTVQVERVCWTQRLEYVHRYAMRVAFVSGEICVARRKTVQGQGTPEGIPRLDVRLDSKLPPGLSFD